MSCRINIAVAAGNPSDRVLFVMIPCRFELSLKLTRANRNFTSSPYYRQNDRQTRVCFRWQTLLASLIHLYSNRSAALRPHWIDQVRLRL
jgi:hypothetical protein